VPTTSVAPSFKLTLPSAFITAHLAHLVDTDFELVSAADPACAWECAVLRRRNKDKHEYTLQGWKAFALAHGVAPVRRGGGGSRGRGRALDLSAHPPFLLPQGDRIVFEKMADPGRLLATIIPRAVHRARAAAAAAAAAAALPAGAPPAPLPPASSTETPGSGGVGSGGVAGSGGGVGSGGIGGSGSPKKAAARAKRAVALPDGEAESAPGAAAMLQPGAASPPDTAALAAAPPPQGPASPPAPLETPPATDASPRAWGRAWDAATTSGSPPRFAAAATRKRSARAPLAPPPRRGPAAGMALLAAAAAAPTPSSLTPVLAAAAAVIEAQTTRGVAAVAGLLSVADRLPAPLAADLRAHADALLDAAHELRALPRAWRAVGGGGGA